MHESEPSDIPVEDRRSASQSASESAPQAEPPSQQPSAEDSPETGFPDPAMLLSFAAMQLDSRALALLLLSVFDSHAWRAMGMVADPRYGETRRDMAEAQLAIDCVQFLLGKVENDLSDSERRDAQRRLTDLRMNFLSRKQEG